MIYLLENPEGCKQQTLARGLLALGLYQEYGITGEIAVKTAPLGKPYLSEYSQIHFNYSHCRCGILCGIHSGEIGVDIENIIPFKENLVNRICHPNERSLFSGSADRARTLTVVWTAKECYLKYLGTGIRSDLRKIDLSACIQKHVPIGEVYVHSILEESYGIGICCNEPQVRIKKVDMGELGRFL